MYEVTGAAESRAHEMLGSGSTSAVVRLAATPQETRTRPCPRCQEEPFQGSSQQVAVTL